MKISAKGRYAVRCLVNLLLTRESSGEDIVSVSRISIQEGVSQNYIEQLFLRLKRSGILKSIRGRSGGYWLARDAGQVTVREIIESVEGKFVEDDKGLPGVCASKYLWDVIAGNIRDMLDNMTLQELCDIARRDLGDELSNRLDCR